MSKIRGGEWGLYAPQNMFSLFQLDLHQYLHLAPGKDSWERLHMELWHERNAVIFLKNVNIFLAFEFKVGYFVNEISQPRSQRVLSRRLEAINRKVTGLES